MIEAIAKRKSIRSFADKKVEAEKVESLLRAAMQTWKPWIGLTQPGFIIISIKMQKKSRRSVGGSSRFQFCDFLLL